MCLEFLAGVAGHVLPVHLVEELPREVSPLWAGFTVRFSHETVLAYSVGLPVVFAGLRQWRHHPRGWQSLFAIAEVVLTWPRSGCLTILLKDRISFQNSRNFIIIIVDLDIRHCRYYVHSTDGIHPKNWLYPWQYWWYFPPVLKSVHCTEWYPSIAPNMLHSTYRIPPQYWISSTLLIVPPLPCTEHPPHHWLYPQQYFADVSQGKTVRYLTLLYHSVN